MLSEKGSVELDGGLWTWIDAARSSVPIREAPPTAEIVSAMERVELPHRDPADRFLAATVAALDLRLVTSDARVLSGRGYRVFSNNG